jgi:glutathione synthase
MSALNASSWPPPLGHKQTEELSEEGATYALANGLLYLPKVDVQLRTPESAIHAPISLTPAPIPRHLFRRVQTLQPLLNKLYSRIALDIEYLSSIMVPMALADSFVRTLWEGLSRLQSEGKLVQVNPSEIHQDAISAVFSRFTWDSFDQIICCIPNATSS